MNREELGKLHNLVYRTYRHRMTIVFEDTPGNDFSCYPVSGKVMLPQSIKTAPTEWSLFAFLHEVGHVLTNKAGMKRCEQEFMATQWALAEAKRIGFTVPVLYIKTYQDYIWNWRMAEEKVYGKGIPTREALTLTGRFDEDLNRDADEDRIIPERTKQGVWSFRRWARNAYCHWTGHVGDRMSEDIWKCEGGEADHALDTSGGSRDVGDLPWRQVTKQVAAPTDVAMRRI